MEITREADYAIRCVFYLSSRPNDVTMIDEIAREMSIPKSFLAKILQKLAKAGIVNSFRGVKGGFQLARAPKDITLLDVVEAIEGPVGMNICVLDKGQCDLSSTCCIHPVWVEIRKDFRKLLGKRDFASLRK
ncbi:MAG: RrF2 family transcriptional regulator [Nitrospirota bacterium]